MAYYIGRLENIVLTWLALYVTAAFVIGTFLTKV
jgi:hypothetical protein